MKELFDMMAAMQGAKDPKMLRTILCAIMYRDYVKAEMELRGNYAVTEGAITDIICGVDMLLEELNKKK